MIYGEDATDPSRSFAGESVDIDYIVKETFGKKYGGGKK
jgi:hypothetical protein